MFRAGTEVRGETASWRNSFLGSQQRTGWKAKTQQIQEPETHENPTKSRGFFKEEFIQGKLQPTWNKQITPMKIPHPICWKVVFPPNEPPPCLFVMTGDFCQSSGHPIPTSTLLIHQVALTLWTSIILIDSRIETLVPEHQTSTANPNKMMRRSERRWNISSMEGFYIFFGKTIPIPNLCSFFQDLSANCMYSAWIG